MSASLRISLTILSIGFAVEGGGEVYSLLTAGSFLPGSGLLFLLPAIVTLLGMLFLLVGRHEWDENHRARVRRAKQIFGLSLLAGVVAVIEVSVLTVYPGIGTPFWAEALFGAAVGAFLLGTFVTYAQLVFHLVTRPSKWALAAATLWALVISALVGQAVAEDLPPILALIAAHSLSVDSLISPVDYLASFLFISYFLLLAAYVDAHLTVVRRRAAWLSKGSTGQVGNGRGAAAGPSRRGVSTSAPVKSPPSKVVATRAPGPQPLPARPHRTGPNQQSPASPRPRGQRPPARPGTDTG